MSTYRCDTCGWQITTDEPDDTSPAHAAHAGTAPETWDDSHILWDITDLQE